MSDFVQKNLFLMHFLPPRTGNEAFRPVAKPPARPAPRDSRSDPAVQREQATASARLRMASMENGPASE